MNKLEKYKVTWIQNTYYSSIFDRETVEKEIMHDIECRIREYKKPDYEDVITLGEIMQVAMKRLLDNEPLDIEWDQEESRLIGIELIEAKEEKDVQANK